MASTTATPTTATSRGALLGSGAVLVWNDVKGNGREQFYQWHDKEHIPERLSIPGFRRGRRYSRPGHSPEWLTIYEADDLNVVVSPEYLHRLNSPTPGTLNTLQYFLNTSRAVCTVVHSVGSSSGGHMLALRLDFPPESTNAVCEYLRTDAFPQMLEINGVLACHLYASDQPGSFLDTAESKTRKFDVPSCVVLVEASIEASAEQARALINVERLAAIGAVMRSDGATYALEICRLNGQAIK